MNIFSKILIGIGLLAVFLSEGCQTAQTRLTEEREVKSKAAQEILSKNVVLLDARPPFNVAAEPIAQAIPIQWRDFATRQAPFENALDADLFFHARRLARMGIGPDTPVIVLGRGASGEGEEGRLAWTLRYMGVKDVKFMTADQFRFPTQNYPSPDRSAVPIWKPEIAEELLIDVKPFLEGVKENKFAIIAVENFVPVVQIPKPTEIPWDKISKLSPESRTKLLKDLLGAKSEKLVVVDSDGVKAASATLWLREAGYQASCLCSGLKNLKN